MAFTLLIGATAQLFAQDNKAPVKEKQKPLTNKPCTDKTRQEVKKESKVVKAEMKPVKKDGVKEVKGNRSEVKKEVKGVKVEGKKEIKSDRQKVKQESKKEVKKEETKAPAGIK